MKEAMTPEIEHWMRLQAANYDDAEDLASAAASHFDVDSGEALGVPWTEELLQFANTLY